MQFFLRLLIIWTAVIYTSQVIPGLMDQRGLEWKQIIYDPLYSSLIIGTIISVFLMILHVARLKKNGYDFNSSHLEPTQSKTVTTSLSVNEIISTISTEFGNTVKKMLPNQIHINVFSMYGWSKLIVSIHAGNEDKISVTIMSKPVIATTIYDYGEGLMLVNKVEKLLVE